jgi:hypothetical protein
MDLEDAIIVDSENIKIYRNKTKEISWQIPWRSYRLIGDLEQQEGENEETRSLFSVFLQFLTFRSVFQLLNPCNLIFYNLT